MEILPELAGAYVAIALVVSPYIYYLLAHSEPLAIHSAQQFSADVLNFVLPTGAMRIGYWHFRSVPQHFSDNVAENGSYLGVALITLICIVAITRWDQSLTKVLIGLLIFVCVASLGPRLHIAGEITVRMPWWLVSEMPLIKHALPMRLSVHAFLIVAIIAALYVSDSERSIAARLTLGILGPLLLMPNLAYFRTAGIGTTAVDTPSLLYLRYL